MDTGYVLKYFSDDDGTARRAYRRFVGKGLPSVRIPS